jgi:outer membrane protein, heavy metal efflux system
MQIKFSFTIVLLQIAVWSLHGQPGLTLREAVALAQKNNPYFSAEKLNVDMAQTDITTASIRPNPSASLSVVQVPFSKDFADNTKFTDPQNRQVTYQVSKPIQIMGQRRYKIKQANEALDIARISLTDYERNFLGQVAQKWLDVWYASQKLYLLSKAKANADTLFSINKIRLRNQVITPTEFSRTEIIYQQYNLMIVGAKQNLLSETKNLTVLLGDSISRTVDSVGFGFKPVAEFDSILSYALLNRADVLYAQKFAQAAQTNILLQNAIAYPQPEIGVSYGSQNKVPYVGAFIAIPLPVFDRNQGQVAKAKISLNQAQTLTNATIQKVKVEIYNAYQEYLTSKSTYEKYEELMGKSDDVLEKVKISYVKGGTTILDYLEAERSWFDMENNHFDAQYNYRKNYLLLLVAANLIFNI